MVDEVVNSRIAKEDLELLDQLVALGYYANRSEAIRAFLSKGLKEFTEKQLTTPNLELLETPPLLTDKQLEDFGKDLFGSSIVELVAEGRER